MNDNNEENPADVEGEVTTDDAANEAMGSDDVLNEGDVQTDAEKKEEEEVIAESEGAEVYKVPQAYRAQVEGWPALGIDEKSYSVKECKGEDCFEIQLKNVKLLQIPAVAKVLKAGAAKQKVKDDGEKSHENHKANVGVAKEDGEEKVSEESDADEGNGEGEGEE